MKRFLLLLGLAAQVAWAQSDTTLKVQVRLVNLFVNVTDAHGAPVADLVQGNFTISEDGIPQTIRVFEKQTNVPLSVVLAIDTSGSTRKDTDLEQHAGHDFAQALLGKRAESPVKSDQLAVFSFDSDVREVTPFTPDARRVDAGLKNLGHGPATAVYAAVLLAAQSLGPRSGRKVLILVSDGGNTVGGTSFDEALAEAQRDDVRIYSLIDTPIEADAGRDTAGEHALITLSQETGGRALYVAQDGLGGALRKVIEDLRTQYLLAYYPQRGGKPELGGPDGFRAVKVTLQDLAEGSTAQPHTRAGYYRAPAGP